MLWCIIMYLEILVFNLGLKYFEGNRWISLYHRVSLIQKGHKNDKIFWWTAFKPDETIDCHKVEWEQNKNTLYGQTTGNFMCASANYTDLIFVGEQ